MIHLRTRAATLVARRGDLPIAATPTREAWLRSRRPRLPYLPGPLGGSEAALVRPMAIDPTCPAGSIAGVRPEERGDQYGVPADQFERCYAAGMTVKEIALLRARLLFRRGDLLAVLAAKAAPETADDAI